MFPQKWIQTFQWQNIVETPPPAAMANRQTVMLHVADPSPFRLCVWSHPTQLGSGFHGFHLVDANISSGFNWVQSWDDTAYPNTGAGWTPVRRPGRLFLVNPGGTAPTRVYTTGWSPLAFAGVVQPAASQLLVAWSATNDEVTVIDSVGKLQSWRVITQLDGTSSVQAGPVQSLGGSGVMFNGANIMVPWDMLCEVQATDGSGLRSLLWLVGGATYSQLTTSGQQLLGSEWYGTYWAGSQALTYSRLIVSRVAGGLRVYYSPGAGGNSSWRALKYVPRQGAAADVFPFPDPSPRIDVWSFKEYDYSPGNPVYIVTADETAGKVRRFQLVPDVVNATFRVYETWTRDAAVRDVKWYRSATGQRRHIELTADGTLRIVTVESLLSRFFGSP